MTAAIERLATRYGRYGYRRIGRLLVNESWRVNVKRVWRIWRRERLKVPSKQLKRGRLWLNDGDVNRLDREGCLRAGWMGGKSAGRRPRSLVTRPLSVPSAAFCRASSRVGATRL